MQPTERVLLVCTANQCRSPMAEALLRHRLAERGIDATVDSAGLMAGGMAATSDAVAVLAERGIDLADHRSRRLPEADLAGADLILTMERRHLQEAVVLAPEVRGRTFTLIELVRRAEQTGPRHRGVRLRDWAEELSSGRTSRDLLGLGGDGIDDPVGRGRPRYEETADLLDDLLRRVVDLAWPPASSPTADAH